MSKEVKVRDEVATICAGELGAGMEVGEFIDLLMGKVSECIGKWTDFSVDLERDEDDAPVLVLYGERPETDEEREAREKRTAISAAMREKYEREKYEELKKKFEGGLK